MLAASGWRAGGGREARGSEPQPVGRFAAASCSQPPPRALDAAAEQAGRRRGGRPRKGRGATARGDTRKESTARVRTQKRCSTRQAAPWARGGSKNARLDQQVVVCSFDRPPRFTVACLHVKKHVPKCRTPSGALRRSMARRTAAATASRRATHDAAVAGLHGLVAGL